MVLVFVDTPAEVIRERLLDNRVTGRRGDVSDDVMAAHRESFQPPEADEQALRLPVGPGPLDLDALDAAVRESLRQPRQG